MGKGGRGGLLLKDAGIENDRPTQKVRQNLDLSCYTFSIRLKTAYINKLLIRLYKKISDCL